jgi:hypothetical protein
VPPVAAWRGTPVSFMNIAGNQLRTQREGSGAWEPLQKPAAFGEDIIGEWSGPGRHRN